LRARAPRNSPCSQRHQRGVDNVAVAGDQDVDGAEDQDLRRDRRGGIIAVRDQPSRAILPQLSQPLSLKRIAAEVAWMRFGDAVVGRKTGSRSRSRARAAHTPEQPPAHPVEQRDDTPSASSVPRPRVCAHLHRSIYVRELRRARRRLSFRPHILRVGKVQPTTCR
jgi:hypothetical protein